MAPLRVDDDFDGHDIFVNGPPHGVPSTTHYGGADADYTTLMAYPEEVDYYSLLGLSRSPPPTGAQIRSAYHNLTLSLHPDKQPPHLREAAEVQFLRVQEAYETLLDPKKRLVYDLLGAETVKREWSTSGVMGSAGPALDKEIGLKTTDLAEFRKWFLDNMKERERKTLDRLVGARGSLTVGLDASSMISPSDQEGLVFLSIPSIHPYKYSIGYTFRSALPQFTSFWSTAKDENDELDEEAPSANAAKLQKLKQTEVNFSASIGGNIATPKQKVNLEFEDGREETTEVNLPPIVVAQSIGLSVNVSHYIANVGLGDKSPTRFWSRLEGATVGCNADFFPLPTLETYLVHSFSPSPRFGLINYTLTSRFPAFLTKCPPSLSVSVSKQIGVRRFVYGTWNSGTLEWPQLLQGIIQPFLSLGMDIENSFLIPSAQSQLQLGYTSVPEPRHENEKDGLNSSPQKPREAWHWRMAASPSGGNLTINYERDLFLGKIHDPPRSEWNLDGHHPMTTLSNEPRGVRFEIQTAVGIDGSLAWNIGGTRQVGSFSRVGLSVSLQGDRGLVMSVSWKRLGQSLKIPVIICPLDLASVDISLCAVVLPWLTYIGVEYGYIRPRERRQRRKEISMRRRQLNKLTVRRKAESQEQIELMAGQVRRRQEREQAQGGLVITKAEYGYIPSVDQKRRNTGEEAETKVVDVTIPVAELVEDSELIISAETVKFHILGFYDPAPLLPKTLRVWYTYGGQQHFVAAGDTDGIACPEPSHLVDA